MSVLTDILLRVLESVEKKFNPELLSPLPKGNVPTDPTKTQKYWDEIDLKEAQVVEDKYGGKPKRKVTGGRNPNWEKWSKQNPSRFAQLLAGAQAASAKYGVPADLLMDISGAETSGGQFLDQISGGPGQGYFQFEPGQSYIPAGFDPYSATVSADLAAKRIAGGNLSNWGTPKGNWGVLDNPNNINGRLTDFYSPEELNPFLAPKYKIQY